jgi:hypothetical protein
MENTPIYIKLSLSRRIFGQNQKISYPRSPFFTLSKGQTNRLTLLSLLKGKQQWRIKGDVAMKYLTGVFFGFFYVPLNICYCT